MQNVIPFVHELLFLCKVCDMMKYVKIWSMQMLIEYEKLFTKGYFSWLHGDQEDNNILFK